jgi:hypothetical protein
LIAVENFIDVSELDEKIESMMTTNLAGGEGLTKTCTVCGKEGKKAHILNHIEASHITGVSNPCTICQKTGFR